MAEIKPTKELLAMSPDEALAEIERMKSDKSLFDAYLDKYSERGYLHDQAVEAITILAERASGGSDGFHPYLDTEQRYDERTQTFVDDKAASRAAYESHVQSVQAKRLRKQGVQAPDLSDIDDKSVKKGDGGPRSIAELKADAAFTKALLDPHGDRGTDPEAHKAAKVEWAAAHQAAYPEPEAE